MKVVYGKTVLEKIRDLHKDQRAWPFQRKVDYIEVTKEEAYELQRELGLGLADLDWQDARFLVMGFRIKVVD